jgi:hypothetical protein
MEWAKLMIREKLDYFITALDMHLAMGKSPSEALAATVEDYAFVYHCDDGRLPIGRAAEVALKSLQNQPKAENNEP